MRLSTTVFLSVAIGEFLSGWWFVGSVWVFFPMLGFLHQQLFPSYHIFLLLHYVLEFRCFKLAHEVNNDISWPNLVREFANLLGREQYVAICSLHGCFLERFHQAVLFFKEVACKELVFCRQCAKITVDCHISISLVQEGLVTYLFEFTMICHISFGDMDKLVDGQLKAKLCEEVGGMDDLLNDLLFHFLLLQ